MNVILSKTLEDKNNSNIKKPLTTMVGVASRRSDCPYFHYCLLKGMLKKVPCPPVLTKVSFVHI